MSQYRKRPVVIQARRWTGDNTAELLAWAGDDLRASAGRLRVETLEGDVWADQGDWIIRGVAGEFYPCKPDIFQATYEPVEATS